MYIDEYREYCLSLGADVEEKLPFVKFKNGYVISDEDDRDYVSLLVKTVAENIKSKRYEKRD